MGGRIGFNREKFTEVFNDHLLALKSMVEAMEAVGDPRDACVIEVMRAAEHYINDLFSAVDQGKKIIWHEFLLFPELFFGFENVHPYMAETLCGLLPVVEPEGLAPYIDAARSMGLPPDICATDSGFLGCVLEGVQPPVDMVVTPTTPCDSALSAYQILTRLIEAPVFYCEMPYWHDGRGVELYSRHIWKMIRRIEEALGTKMDWDRCREHIHYANEAVELFLEETEMRKLTPCPHPGKLQFFQFLFFTIASGTPYFRDICRFIAEDGKRLAAEKRGVLEEEKIRILFYNPDPVYDVGIHDWLEDEYGAITALTFFGHATATLIDPSTPESIVKDYAWKMMNTCMARQYRGPHEFFVDDMIAAIEGWNIDAVIVTAHIPCKHGQAIHGFVRDACREREKPLLLVEIDVQDPRPVPIDTVRDQVADFLETQVLPSL